MAVRHRWSVTVSLNQREVPATNSPDKVLNLSMCCTRAAHLGLWGNVKKKV